MGIPVLVAVAGRSTLAPPPLFDTGEHPMEKTERIMLDAGIDTGNGKIILVASPEGLTPWLKASVAGKQCNLRSVQYLPGKTVSWTTLALMASEFGYCDQILDPADDHGSKKDV